MKNMSEFITNVWPVIFVCLLQIAAVVVGFLSVSLVRAIKKKVTVSTDQAINDRIYGEIEDLINKCVVAVNQKFVETVKSKYGTLTDEDAKTAFNMVKSMILAMLTEENLQYIRNKYVDVDAFLEYFIEFDVHENKLMINDIYLDETKTST